MPVAVFDIDGTLTDTFDVDVECYERAIREDLGIDIPSDWPTFDEVTDAAILRTACERLGRSLPDEETLDRIAQRVAALLEEVLAREPERFRAIPGAPASGHQELVESAGGTPERQPRVPDTQPSHGPLLVDDEDRVWVRRVLPGGEPPGWDVIGPGGEYVAHVRLPEVMNATLRSVRSGRLEISAELDGVPTVIVYDIRGGS